MIRAAMLWGGVSGYAAACWRAMAARTDVALRVLVPAPNASAPFDASLMSGFESRLLTPTEVPNYELVRDELLKNDPQVIVLPGWMKPLHPTKLAADPKLAGRRLIMFLDTPFRGTWRQYLGKWANASYFKRLSLAVGAGDRSRTLAQILGINDSIVRTGCYGIDFPFFEPALAKRVEAGSWPRRFLFSGRYFSADKGLDLLVEGYRLYRERVTDPWELSTCGAGPDEGLVAGKPGITNLRFVQPDQQQALYASVGAFVLPSRYDPWPLVIVEACASGLPVLCSSRCGSAVDLVRPYYNGQVFASDHAEPVAGGMQWLHEELERDPSSGYAMGVRSQQLARPFGADFWAARWAGYFQEALREKMPGH